MQGLFESGGEHSSLFIQDSPGDIHRLCLRYGVVLPKARGLPALKRPEGSQHSLRQMFFLLAKGEGDGVLGQPHHPGRYEDTAAPRKG